MSPTFSADSLPNRFDHTEARQRIYARWEQQGYFHAEPSPHKPPFTIVIPPPNVTGALHLGHALNNTLQDVLIRMKRMQGYATLWMPGTDHAGIATQAVVERRLKDEEHKTRHDLGREELVRRIWQWKDEYEARILSQLKQMGCSCDWQRTRFTLDDTCARAVRCTFFDLFRQGLIYRGKRLVNWDPFLQTAVSDDEVFHEEVHGHFWHFHYPVIDPRPGEPVYVTIATTRPETMLGDTAVAVHPDPAGALDRAEAALREKLDKAPSRERQELQQQIEAIEQRRRDTLPRLQQLRAMASDGRQLRLPLLDRVIPLVADEWAKPELGSGCVKITPAHDANDYEVGRRQNLPMINILNPDGTLNANAGPYQGLNMLDARRRVVEDMREQSLLVDVEDRLIDLAHSDRSKTPIEPYLADQWFVQMDRLAGSAMNAVNDGRVRILPSRYSKTYLDWLGEKRDWCIGRQLWWGHRIPVWSRSCDRARFGDLLDEVLHALPKGSVIRATIAERPYLLNTADDAALTVQRDKSIAAAGAEDSGEIVLQVCPLQGEDQAAEGIERLGFVQDPDVLDTWFSSSLWPHSTMGWPDCTAELECFYPTSVLITSRDIITLWVARMVLMGLNNTGEVPFRDVFIHPKILDGYGETMSKSKGNGIDPLDVIDKFGADALRFGMAHLTTETQDVRMPVQYECPHCEALIEQTKKNREFPRIKCTQCGGEFATQWARSDSDRALPRGAVVSERFEVARNFVNKLWNASRFALLNLNGYECGVVAEEDLTLEDRWILSRLATVTQQVTQSLDAYHYADAARTLYDFAWDEFCSFYVEMLKNRLQDAPQQTVAQRVLAHTLDVLLRLLHPMIPFITEEVWQLLGRVAPQRGLEGPRPASPSVMIAPWPVADTARQDAEIEARFAQFQAVLGALREIRSRQNIPPKSPLEFCVRCSDPTRRLLEPMDAYFASMANATGVAWGQSAEPPATHAVVNLAEMDVYVDLKDFIDVAAEIARNEKLQEKLAAQIRGKQNKLANDAFVQRAPAEVVQNERDSLVQLQQQLAATQTTLERLQQSTS
jgi:valyl-tRNA synthetase